MGTGEGKSLIIAMLAAFYVLRGAPRVNVLVDNLSLLERDFATFDSLYSSLGIAACSAAGRQAVEPATRVCYHTAHSLEVQYLQGLTAGEAAAIPEGAVLIVDEVRATRERREREREREKERKSGDLGPKNDYFSLSETGTGNAPAGTTKTLATALHMTR